VASFFLFSFWEQRQKQAVIISCIYLCIVYKEPNEREREREKKRNEFFHVLSNANDQSTE
jgi:hypothetical protein